MIERPSPGSIPAVPGSYQFRDGEGRVIYVGKAKSLRSRVLSYFANPDTLPAKTRAMMSAAESLTWIKVGSDAEAFLLEYSLIKEHRPRYNIQFRDDSSYPMIAVTVGERWPRAMLVRGARRPKVRYYGPYASSGAARETLELLLRTLPLRSCSQSKFAQHEREGRPCLYYHISRCSGPCIGAVGAADYQIMVEKVTEFLGGKGGALSKDIEAKMREAAASEEFESAARYRDQLTAIRSVLERQTMVTTTTSELDVMGIFADELQASIQVLRIRSGRVVGARGMILDRVEELAGGDLIAKAAEVYYDSLAVDFPKEVVLPEVPQDVSGLAASLSLLAGRRVVVSEAKRGRRRTLVELAGSNAEEEFKRKRLLRARDYNARSEALVSIASELGLQRHPLRIECYDMSHLQGTNYVGSMVVMEDGLMKPSAYRHFRVSVPGNDDFAAMAEVLERRLRRLSEDSPEGTAKHFAYRPNLIVLDGGAGQLSVGVAALEHSGLSGEIDLCSLAKSYEEVYRPGLGEPIRIARGSSALYFLQQLRDEAHRFAIQYHRRRRSLSMELSVLDTIKGLGPKRRAALIERFGSVFELAKASPEEIAATRLVGAELAARIVAVLSEIYPR